MNHGEWLPMLEDIGIDKQYAQRLMRIGSNEALSNASHVTHLPNTLRVLLELSRMEPEDIEAGIGEAIKESLLMRIRSPTDPRVRWHHPGHTRKGPLP